MKSATAIILGILALNAVALGAPTVIQIQAVVDGQSELVISPTGIFWHHIDHAKPGNYGENYDLAGPTYVDGAGWTPTWTKPVEQRVEDVSGVLAIDATGFSGFALSSQYGNYFDAYPELVGGNWVTLGPLVDLNRGSMTLSSYNGLPSVLINDTQPGQNVYSFDLQIPEPATMGLLALSGLVVLRRRRKGEKR